MYKRFWTSNKINTNIINIDGEEHNHICNVLRMKVGDNIIVNCNDEYDYVCEIVEINKKATLCKVLSIDLNKHNPTAHIDMFQALIKNDKMSLITQKLNEVGINNLFLFESKYQTVKPSDNKKDKLQKISDQSAKQCKRSKSMMVNDIISFNQMLQTIKLYDIVIFANETEDSKELNSILSKILSSAKIAIIIGAEGGFADSEIKDIIDAGAISVTLGKRILRAETASITLAGFVSYITNN